LGAVALSCFASSTLSSKQSQTVMSTNSCIRPIAPGIDLALSLSLC
jgi:hypothetical protein